MNRKILSDQYWHYVENLITLVRPIVNWITILESDTPSLSVVPEALNEIKQNFITYIPISPLLEVEGTMLLKKIDERITWLYIQSILQQIWLTQSTKEKT